MLPDQRESNDLMEESEWYEREELRKLYPFTEVARELGICYQEEKGDFSYRSDWSPLAIRTDSYLGWLLSLPFTERLRDIRQLGPNRRHPYTYDHTIWQHEAEQLVRGVARLGYLAEEYPDLFLEGTASYRLPVRSDSEHITFILQVASWFIMLHDAESLPLRDTAKYAFKTRLTQTDENKLLIARLQNPNDTKYRPHLKLAFGDRENEVVGILCRIAGREDNTFIGDFLHSRAGRDPSDPSGRNRPLDVDRITYTIQDLYRVGGSILFDKRLSDAESGLGVLFLSDMFFKVANLKHLERMMVEGEDWWARVFHPRKTNPAFLDLVCDAVLARRRDGSITVAYAKHEKVLEFLDLASLENFPSLYLTPAMIYTEKAFELTIQKRFLKWNRQKRLRFLHRISDWTDAQLLRWLEAHWPGSVAEISDKAYTAYWYNHEYEDEKLSRRPNTVVVPVQIHAATSTPVVDDEGYAVSIAEIDPEAIKEYRDTLRLYDGRWLSIKRERASMIEF